LPYDQSDDEDRGHRGADSHPSDGVGDPAKLRSAVPEGYRADRSEWIDGVPSAGRNGQKRPNHDGIELGAGVCRQLEASSFGGPWLVVTVKTCSGVIEVGHRYDPSTQRNLVTHQPERITGPVEAFMVLGNRVCPVAEPGRQGSGESRSFEWVPAHHFPFVIRQSGGLVENVGTNRHLADVMEKGGPPQPVAIVLGQAKPLGDQVGEGPDTFGVPAGLAVAGAEGGGQHQELLCRDGRVVVDAREL
jgi:hypothetical protein